MSLQGKTTMSDDFELGEDETEPTSNVTFSTSLRITRIENRRAFACL